MRNMLALFAALLLTVAGLGWYLDWYRVRSQPAGAPGQRSVSIDFNTTKIGTDLHKGEQKLQEIIDSKKDQAQKATDQAKKIGADAKSAGDAKGILPEIKVHLNPSIQLNGGESAH